MSGEEPHSDAELIRRSAAGDAAAFGELMKRHEAAVFRFARAISPDDAAAEDALQEAFLGAWRGARTFRGDASVRNWLLTIVRNAIYRQHRKRVDEPEDIEPLSELGLAAGWGEEENPETIALQRESRHLLNAAMERLSAPDREILLLRDVEGLSGDEVATMLGLTLTAMKTRLHRARLRIASKVREAYEHA
ncbi:MAG TPA: sigma-70 family RNA polymerase sigma factor [Thermoanaerobaculia bacterium]|jgi:RNA polymerase sigma-70 factor (ECF subfamily)|nr:sigma-70 family RNA polymerase sigma factor [Thermoanaerobaculia bacterium]